MSAQSVNLALQCDAIAVYAQKVLDQIKSTPTGIDPLVEVKINGEIGGVQFLAKIFRNQALTVGGFVAGNAATDASGGPGAVATNAALTAILTAAG